MNCTKCALPVTSDGVILSGAPYHRKCRPARPWVRPAGCECDATDKRGFKCTAQWMRCKARIEHVMREKRRRDGQRCRVA